MEETILTNDGYHSAAWEGGGARSKNVDRIKLAQDTTKLRISVNTVKLGHFLASRRLLTSQEGLFSQVARTQARAHTHT